MKSIMKRIMILACALIVMLVFVGCGSKNTFANVEIPFEKYFNNYTGSFKIYDISNDCYLAYNEEQLTELDSPASTYKILHSLIALETGVLQDENSKKEWNGSSYTTAAWNRDHTLKSAVDQSVVWYFQEVAKEIGKEKMQHYLDAADYGNKTIGENLDRFWLDDSLKISADQQLDFITKLYKEELPFDKAHIKTVKDILVNQKNDSITLSGKTGSFVLEGKPSIGWYVGYITTSDNKTYTFVTKLEGESAPGFRAKEITKQILKDLEIYK